jgi:hypothetical protein
MKIEFQLRTADDDMNDNIVLNFHKMLSIVKELIDDVARKRDTVKEMTKHRSEHLVLLLSGVNLRLVGVVCSPLESESDSDREGRWRFVHRTSTRFGTTMSS